MLVSLSSEPLKHLRTLVLPRSSKSPQFSVLLQPSGHFLGPAGCRDQALHLRFKHSHSLKPKALGEHISDYTSVVQPKKYM